MLLGPQSQELLEPGGSPLPKPEPSAVAPYRVRSFAPPPILLAAFVLALLSLQFFIWLETLYAVLKTIATLVYSLA